MDGPIDPEINFHGNLAESWWDKDLFRALRNLNEVRVPFIRDGIHQLMLQNADSNGSKTELQGVHILDVGCGGGILSEALARLKANVTGLDPSSDLIRIARKHAELDPQLAPFLRYESLSIHHYCQKNERKFDAIVVSEVIEHIANKEQFIEDCLICLKPGGSIFFTTPNKTFAAKWLIIKLAERFHVIPPGTHHFEKFITAEKLTEMLVELGCSIRRVEGIFFNIVTRKFRFSSFNYLMYALHAQKTR